MNEIDCDDNEPGRFVSLLIEPSPGDHVADVARTALSLYLAQQDEESRVVGFSFNGRNIRIKDGDTVDDLVKRYLAGWV